VSPVRVPADRDESWPVVESRDLFRDDWVIALRSDRIHRPGAPAEEGSFSRLVLEHPGAAVVLALDDAERVLCLRQYRHPAGRRFLELPAGLCDEPGEEPLEVARRELREEAELQAEEWTHLLTAYSSPGIIQEQHHHYVARGLSAADRGAFAPEHEEADAQLLWLELDDLVEAIFDGRVTDGPLVTAVLAYLARFRRP
jgi:8-oxo-dGTP pyrophosphatase MutT (NUDIX family)